MKSHFVFVSIFTLGLPFVSAFADSDSNTIEVGDLPLRPCKAIGVQFCIKNAEGGYEWTDAVEFNPTTCEAKLPAYLEAAESALCNAVTAPF